MPSFPTLSVQYRSEKVMTVFRAWLTKLFWPHLSFGRLPIQAKMSPATTDFCILLPVTSSRTVNEIVPSSNKAQSDVFEGDIFRIDFFGGDVLEGVLFGNEMTYFHESQQRCLLIPVPEGYPLLHHLIAYTSGC